MREIKFRGFSAEMNKWVYGSLVNNLWTYSELTDKKGRTVCEIVTGEYEGDCWEDIVEEEGLIVSVIPASVGQYTGLNDNQGKEIYEGDICNHVPKFQTIYVCKYLSSGFYLCPASEKEYGENMNSLFTGFDREVGKCNSLEIIGNIYEDTNLLKK